ncbi:MAG: class II glutamine amidotransferase [Fusicatenibacter sp.]
MCELFGVSSKNKVQLNEMLKEFASHSVRHPNGWGMAVFYGNSVSLEKEPVPACKSVYLRERLRHTFRASNMIAHIRLATRGTTDFENCHPFVMRDNSNRTWTLAHNGTIFDCPVMTKYVHTQEGQTDSEQFYVHTNYANSLYVKQSEDTAFFATVPLDRGNWKPAEFTTLLGYKDGRQIFTGTNHGQEYIDNPKDMQFIFVDYASL